MIGGRLVAGRRPDTFGRKMALQATMFRGRLVAGKRPDVFERQMALQMIKFSDVWSPASGQTLSHGDLHYTRFRGRLAAGRRPNFFERQKGFTNHTPNGKASTFGPPPERSPKFGKNRGSRGGQPRGASKGQPGCTRGQSLGESGAAGKGVNSPNLRKKGQPIRPIRLL